eukprot:1161127-Pelagomonas_calceolata.AAC.18
MAKAILESAARGRDLGAITLNLPFCEPLWKLLLGQPLHLVDLQVCVCVFPYMCAGAAAAPGGPAGGGHMGVWMFVCV